jgi:hypothetical protein
MVTKANPGVLRYGYKLPHLPVQTTGSLFFEHKPKQQTHGVGIFDNCRTMEQCRDGIWFFTENEQPTLSYRAVRLVRLN